MKVTRFTLPALLLPALLLPVLFAVAASAESQQCTLEISEAPQLCGLRLEMSAAEFKEVFPVAQVREDRFGVSYGDLSTTSPNMETKISLTGVQVLHAVFLDSKLKAYYVRYSPTTWDSAEQFANFIGEKLRLPKAWKFNGSTQATLTCDGFRVDADADSNSPVSVAQK